jgi:hypothetical protein
MIDLILNVIIQMKLIHVAQLHDIKMCKVKDCIFLDFERSCKQHNCSVWLGCMNFFTFAHDNNYRVLFSTYE